MTLEECVWPTLPPKYDAALRQAVQFVFEITKPIGIVASGTIVRGTAHATSDLDIYVVHTAAFRRRVQKFFDKVPAEIFVNPPIAVRSYFQQEHRAGRPLTAHMLDSGVVIWSNGPVIHELRLEASDWMQRRSSMTDEERIRARYGAATRFEDGVDVADTDPATAAMLLARAVIDMLELECRKRGGHVPRGKDLLTAIAKLDPNLGALANAFFTATTFGARRAAAEAIADVTIHVRGFFEWDSGEERVNPPGF